MRAIVEGSSFVFCNLDPKHPYVRGLTARRLLVRVLDLSAQGVGVAVRRQECCGRFLQSLGIDLLPRGALVAWLGCNIATANFKSLATKCERFPERVGKIRRYREAGLEASGGKGSEATLR